MRQISIDTNGIKDNDKNCFKCFFLLTKPFFIKTVKYPGKGKTGQLLIAEQHAITYYLCSNSSI